MMVGEEFDLQQCHNTTSCVAVGNASGRHPPDREHIARVLEHVQPELVIACGRQAERALAKAWPGALLAVPHPVHRVLTDALYIAARGVLERGKMRAEGGRGALRQRRGRIEWEAIPGPVKA